MWTVKARWLPGRWRTPGQRPKPVSEARRTHLDIFAGVVGTRLPASVCPSLTQFSSYRRAFPKGPLVSVMWLAVAVGAGTVLYY